MKLLASTTALAITAGAATADSVKPIDLNNVGAHTRFESLADNSIQWTDLRQLKQDLRDASKIFLETAGRFISRGQTGYGDGEENSTITLENAAQGLRELLTSLEKNDRDMCRSVSGWVREINTAFWIVNEKRYPESPALHTRIKEYFKDLDLVQSEPTAKDLARRFGLK